MAARVVASALGALTASGAVSASYLRLHHVFAAVRFEPVELARRLGREPQESALLGMSSAIDAEGDSWEGSLLRDLLAARSPAARVATVNESVSDLASTLDWGAQIPAAAARGATFAPMCVAFFLLASGGADVIDVAALFLWMGVGVLGALTAGSLARQRADELRSGADSFVARAMLSFEATDVALSGSGSSMGSAVDPSRDPV